MARVHGEGLHGSYEASLFPSQQGLYWLKKKSDQEKDPARDWATSIDRNLAIKIDRHYGGNGKSFKEACDEALRIALLMESNKFDYKATARSMKKDKQWLK